MNYNIRKFLAVVSCSLAATLVLCFAILAWSEPGATPPGGNVTAPVNTGSNAQSKVGDLSIGSGLKYWIAKDGDSFVLKNNAGDKRLTIDQSGNVMAAVKITAPELCLNGVCKTAWPEMKLQPKTCPAGQAMTGVDGSANIICGG